jgi:hypothetical protein
VIAAFLAIWRRGRIWAIVFIVLLIGGLAGLAYWPEVSGELGDNLATSFFGTREAEISDEDWQSTNPTRTPQPTNTPRPTSSSSIEYTCECPLIGLEELTQLNSGMDEDEKKICRSGEVLSAYCTGLPIGDEEERLYCVIKLEGMVQISTTLDDCEGCPLLSATTHDDTDYTGSIKPGANIDIHGTIRKGLRYSFVVTEEDYIEVCPKLP